MAEHAMAFRVDSSSQTGTGHFMRCLTLADALQQRGAQCRFVSRHLPEYLRALLTARRHDFRQLGSKPEDVDELPYSPWLGTSQQADAQDTVKALSDRNWDWLIVDNYAIDHRWEHLLRPHVNSIMVIDDLADRLHDCDLLIDQNLLTDMKIRYAGKIPEHCKTMLGPEYALLQPIYAELHNRIPPREGSVRRILIYFGGADTDNLTGRSISAFLNLNRRDIEVDVVVSPSSPYMDAVRNLAEGHSNIHVHDALPTLAPLMTKADLAIGAGGATSWERCCLGLPSLVITLAENQKSIAEGLQQSNLICWLGHKDKVDESAIEQALSKLIQQGIVAGWSRQCMASVDGTGVNQVCAVLTVTATTPLKVRHALLRDEALLLNWANDPMVRKNAFHPERITAKEHHQWFYDRLRDIDGCKLYIVETMDGIPIGQVRFERLEDQTWLIDYSLAPVFRGLGLGCSLLKTALLRMREDKSGALILGQVKESNQPSIKVFESLGFDAQIKGGGWNIGVCSDRDSWINAKIPELILTWSCDGHKVTWVHDADELPKGDICFYLSYGRIVEAKTLALYRNNLVVHESDLPRGRGWSPLTWQVLEEKNEIPITLLEAAERVDSGDIYLTDSMHFSGLELVGELRAMQARYTVLLCNRFVLSYPKIVSRARKQEGEVTFYPRRSLEDSELNLDSTVREQFNLLRVVDNDRYPAFIRIGERKYKLKIEEVQE